MRDRVHGIVGASVVGLCKIGRGGLKVCDLFCGRE